MEPPVEPIIRQIRHRQANKYLPKDRSGTILDIGCGLRAIWLRKIEFSNKIGLEIDEGNFINTNGINLIKGDITKKIPLPDESVDCVTMLAVMEHIDEESIPFALEEIHRVLKKGGRFVMTAPVHKAEAIISFLAKIYLLSHEEAEEHKEVYDPHKTVQMLKNLGFSPVELKFFELGYNSLICADKI